VYVVADSDCILTRLTDDEKAVKAVEVLQLSTISLSRTSTRESSHENRPVPCQVGRKRSDNRSVEIYMALQLSKVDDLSQLSC
jgi:hypothetical protein